MNATGHIERIDEDGVAWGSFDDGRTFDIPSHGYPVGAEVVEIVRPDDADTSETGDVAYLLNDGEVGTLLVCEFTDEGMEIINTFKLRKEQ